MRKSVSTVLAAFVLSCGVLVADQPTSVRGYRDVAVQQAQRDQQREGGDPIDRVIRLLKRVFHVVTSGDGMTGPKP